MSAPLPPDEHLQLLFECREYLGQAAEKFFKAKLNPNEYTFVCINADDPTWTALVNIILPGHDWQSIRDKGLIPLARAVVPSSIKESIIKMFPDTAEIFAQHLPPGHVRIAVLSFGVSLYVLRYDPPDGQMFNPNLN